MRILQVTNSLITGGAEKLLADTLPKYNQKEVQMDLVLLNGTDYPFLQQLRANKSCQIYTFSMGSAYNPMHLFRLLKFMKTYDLIHVHLFPSLYWVALASMLKRARVPLVFTEHNSSNKRRDHWLFSRLDRFIYKRYAKIVTISEEVDQALKSHLQMEACRFHLIKNGVDINRIKTASPATKSEFNIAEDTNVLLQVSSFTEQKDQPTLIRAMQYLPESTALLLVGSGPTQEACEALVTQLELENRVHFLGVRMDVPELLAMADVVVLSTHFEGLSLASIEGLASGSPFVASDAPGLSNVVNTAGVLFPIGDEKQLAQRVQALLTDASYYNKVVASCQQEAEKYSMDRMIDAHLNLYEQLCAPN